MRYSELWSKLRSRVEQLCEQDNLLTFRTDFEEIVSTIRIGKSLFRLQEIKTNVC